MMNKRIPVLTLLMSWLLVSIGFSFSYATVRIGDLETMSPEEAGMSEAKLDSIIDFCEEHGSAALLILYDGKIVLAWGEVERKYPIHSIRKAMLNSLYGIYVERGSIDTSATLEELSIDDIPPALTRTEKQATVRDLLGSRSGVYHPAAAEAQSMVDDRPERGSQEPGSFFYYNNWDFNTLGTIFEQETGEKIFEAFYREIALPLGMKHFRGSYGVIHDSSAGKWDVDGNYMYEKNKSIHPAYHFNMTAYDMALYGLLYMNDGRWNGMQIVPPGWIAESTKQHSLMFPELGLGYGYLWYVFPEIPVLGRSFFHTGSGIHMLFVAPERKIVMVHRVDTFAEDIRFTPGDMFDMLTDAIYKTN
jgi:CubicO group peptidase (beta-lactamase class C family)